MGRKRLQAMTWSERSVPMIERHVRVRGGPISITPSRYSNTCVGWRRYIHITLVAPVDVIIELRCCYDTIHVILTLGPS